MASNKLIMGSFIHTNFSSEQIHYILTVTLKDFLLFSTNLFIPSRWKFSHLVLFRLYSLKYTATDWINVWPGYFLSGLISQWICQREVSRIWWMQTNFPFRILQADFNYFCSYTLFLGKTSLVYRAFHASFIPWNWAKYKLLLTILIFLSSTFKDIKLL